MRLEQDVGVDQLIFVQQTGKDTKRIVVKQTSTAGLDLVHVSEPISESQTTERVQTMRAYGAELVLTPAAQGMKARLIVLRLLAPQANALRTMRRCGTDEFERFARNVDAAIVAN